MNYYTYDDEFAEDGMPVASRATFITKTYLHLLGALFGFVGILTTLFATGLGQSLGEFVIASGGFVWLGFLAAFMVVSWLASRMADSIESKPTQYLGLGAYVFFEALLFCPLIYIANRMAPGILGNAALISVSGFLVLTAIAFITRKDFSFLRPLLMWGGVMAIGLIVCGVIFGFELGLIFSFAMVALAGGSILYDTSNIIHHYHEDQYVSASIELFASFALLLWYVIRILMSLARE